MAAPVVSLLSVPPLARIGSPALLFSAQLLADWLLLTNQRIPGSSVYTAFQQEILRISVTVHVQSATRHGGGEVSV